MVTMVRGSAHRHPGVPANPPERLIRQLSTRRSARRARSGAFSKLVERGELALCAPVLLLGFGGGLSRAGQVVGCP